MVSEDGLGVFRGSEEQARAYAKKYGFSFCGPAK